MTSFRIRPRFKAHSDKNQEQLLKHIKSELSKDERSCDGIVIPGHVTLMIKPQEQHYWSPQLQLTLEEHQNGTEVHGLYGPKPQVWTLFALSYLASGILFLFISIIGFSRLSLGLSAPILWALPVLAGISIFLYISSQLGQKLGAEQTFTLHHFMEEILEIRIHIE
jgi:hypothetical protein